MTHRKCYAGNGSGENIYRVTWEIDLDADSPRQAAEKALLIHRNPESIATVFAVTGKNGETLHVDLMEAE